MIKLLGRKIILMNKVTIITSVYNGGKHIKGFLENIVRQTIFDECELFLLDANSPDNEYEVIKEYKENWGSGGRRNIKYERLDSDPGIYPCWNHMIENSESKYITNANLDDRLFSTCLEKHFNFLENNDSIDVAYCYNIVTNIPDQTEDKLFGTQEVFTTGEFSIENMLAANLPHNHPVWRRSLHEKFGYFTDEFISGSDWEFWLRCAFGGSKMALIKEPLGIYYQNPEGVSTKSENMKRNLKEVADIRERYIGRP